MEEQTFYSIILRHDTSTKWMVNNPILSLGEYGVEDDTHKVKRGDGESKWSELVYEDFGLTYIVTYSNLTGEVTDNEKLKNALESKVQKDTFIDVDNKVVSAINLTNEEGTITTISKIMKDISSAGTSKNILKIVSNDNSVQGYWTITDDGARVLDIRARSSIDDYQVGFRYYEDQLCFHNNRLYRCIETYDAAEQFDETKWVILASLRSNDIKFDNKVSGLEAEDVKNAIDELTDRTNHRVKTTSKSSKIYGTDESGEQFTYDIEFFGKVDTVNGVKATANKNVQIDGNDIAIDKTAEEKTTINEALDSKVAKDVTNSKIVQNVSMSYNGENGKLSLDKELVSLADGSKETQSQEIDVVSERELSDTKQTLENSINTLTETVANNKSDIETIVNNNKAEIENTVATNKTDIEKKLTDATNTLNETIENAKQELSSKETEDITAVYNKIETTKSEVLSKEAEDFLGLQNQLASARTDLEAKINAKGTSVTEETDTKLATKVNKSIGSSLVTSIEVSEESDDPTIKITSADTETENKTITHLHISSKGNISTYKDAEDHIIVDSTEMDKSIAANAKQIEIQGTSIVANETATNNLGKRVTEAEKHIALHDQTFTQVKNDIATNANGISDNKNKLLAHDLEISAIKEKEAKDITDANNAIASNSAKITNINQTLLDYNDKMQETAETLAETNDNILNHESRIQVVERKATEAEASAKAIENAKLDKTFADSVLEKVSLGDLTSQDILVINQNLVNPETYSKTKSSLRITSKDNTLVGKTLTDEDGNIVGIDLSTNLDVDVNYFVTSALLIPTIPSENIVRLDTLTATDKTEVEVQDIISDAEGTWARVSSINKTLGTCVAVTFAKQARAAWGTIRGTLEDQTDLQSKLNTLQTNINNEATARGNDKVELESKISQAKSDAGDYTDTQIETLHTTVTGEIRQAKSDVETKLNTATETLNNKITTAQQTLEESIATAKTGAETTAKEYTDSKISEVKTTSDAKYVAKISGVDKVYGTDSNGNQTAYDKGSFGKVDTVNNKMPDAGKNVTLTSEDIGYDNTTSTLQATTVKGAVDELKSAIDSVASQLNLDLAQIYNKLVEINSETTEK